MKNALNIGILALLLLAGCTVGSGSCVNDNFCSIDEQVRGNCNDCKPDFEPVDLQLSFKDSSVADTLREGETKTYTIEDAAYDVTLVFVSDPGSNSKPVVKFALNGELTDSMQVGDSEILAGGTTIHVTEIFFNKREGVARFRISTPQSGGILYYNYCVQNNGGAFDGEVPVTVYAAGALGAAAEEQTQYVSFQKSIAYGNFQVVQTADGVRVYSGAELNQDDEAQYFCMSGEKPVTASNDYYLNIDVDAQDDIAERDEDNNYASVHVPGAPVYFPRYLFEDDSPGIDYKYSEGTPDYKFSPFPSGGGHYFAVYHDTSDDMWFSVVVAVPKSRSEGQEAFDMWMPNAMYIPLSGIPVKVETYEPFDYNGQQMQLLSILMKGKNDEVIQAGIFVEADRFELDDDDTLEEQIADYLDDHPIIREYMRMYGTPVVIVPPQPDVPGCTVNEPFDCVNLSILGGPPAGYGDPIIGLALRNNQGNTLDEAKIEIYCADHTVALNFANIANGAVLTGTYNCSQEYVNCTSNPMLPDAQNCNMDVRFSIKAMSADSPGTTFVVPGRIKGSFYRQTLILATE